MLDIALVVVFFEMEMGKKKRKGRLLRTFNETIFFYIFFTVHFDLSQILIGPTPTLYGCMYDCPITDREKKER